MKKKLVLSIVIAILSIMLIGAGVSANEGQIVKVVDGTKVTLYPEAQAMPNELIQEVVSENQDANNLIIYEYGEIEETDGEEMVRPFAAAPTWTQYTTTKATTATNVVGKDQFQFSVARGEKVTISKTYSLTLGASVSTPSPWVSIGVSGSVTGSYKKSTTYSGPPNSSSYNSREFRLKIYENRGTWKQVAQGMVGQKPTGSPVTRTGTWKKPTSWASYSVDKKI